MSPYQEIMVQTRNKMIAYLNIIIIHKTSQLYIQTSIKYLMRVGWNYTTILFRRINLLDISSWFILTLLLNRVLHLWSCFRKKLGECTLPIIITTAAANCGTRTIFSRLSMWDGLIPNIVHLYYELGQIGGEFHINGLNGLFQIIVDVLPIC